MAKPPTEQTLYASATEFARSAVDAHHGENPRRLALDAGTALEHLAKACLVKRSPALLTELRNEGNWHSLLVLVGIPEGKPKQLRTVGLRDALTRVKTFVSSPASDDDLKELVDLRDGVVHAGHDENVADRLLVSFIQHAHAMLADLGRDVEPFWGERYAVVEALLAEVTDRVAHRVSVKIAAARASFDRQYDFAPEVLEILRRIPKPPHLGQGEETQTCPACESDGIAEGEYEVVDAYDRDGIPSGREVLFIATGFRCPMCGLHLDSVMEMSGSPIPDDWEIEGADPDDYEDEYEPDPDLDYHQWREDQM